MGFDRSGLQVSRAALAVVMVVACGFLASCQTETAVSTLTPAEPATAPRKTGVYPDFSQPLAAATQQMSDQEALGLQAQLTNLGKLRKSGAISEAEYQRRVAELRKLAEDNKAKTAQ